MTLKPCLTHSVYPYYGGGVSVGESKQVSVVNTNLPRL